MSVFYSLILYAFGSDVIFLSKIKHLLSDAYNMLDFLTSITYLILSIFLN